MIQNVSAIVIAAAAVIGLVPLGVRSIRDLLKSRQRKRNNEQLGTVAISVFLSLIAPGALEAISRHVKAAGDALPDWVKAAIPQPPAGPLDFVGGPPQHANGAEPQPTSATGSPAAKE
jgi:hypothetical protein